MENNRSLLHDFDLARAKAGEAICWSYLHIPCSFVGEAAYGKVAMKNDGGFIEIVDTSSLRMKPLFWKEGKPVYAGDRLWHSLSRKWITVERLQSNPDAEQKGHFYGTDGSRRDAALCKFEEPPEPLFTLEGKPVNKGDRLWHKRDNCWITVTGMYLTGDFIDEAGRGRSPCYCTWEKPTTTVVRYANVYADLPNGQSRYLGELYPTPDGPKGVCGSEKSLGIARIEWQE